MANNTAVIGLSGLSELSQKWAALVGLFSFELTVLLPMRIPVMVYLNSTSTLSCSILCILCIYFCSAQIWVSVVSNRILFIVQ